MSAVASHREMQDLISARQLGQMFREALGWDNPRQEPLPLDADMSMAAQPVASKKMVDVWRVPCPAVPAAPERHKIIRRIRKLYSLETLIVFDGNDGNMLWLWPEQRPVGDSYKAVAHECDRHAVDDEMLDRLAGAAFALEEEDDLTISDVLSRVRRSLGADIADLDREVERAVLDAAAPLSGDAGLSERIGEVLSQEGGEQSNRMAAAIMFNAVVFQHHIASHHPGKVRSLEEIRSADADRALVAAEWDTILDINYWPIFGIARKLLDAIDDDGVAAILAELYGSASDKVAHRATQGLVGELFGRLIVDRKFLATYYTRPQSASFLAEMAVDRLEVDWSDPDTVTSLRVADLACGTGALLTAAYRRIAARHEDAGGDPAELHKKVMEEVLIGCDIMPTAVHLTNHRRIRERLDANAVVFGGGERFFGTDDEEAALRDAIYNEDPQDDADAEVDVVSMAYEIWRAAQRDHPDKAAEAEALPNVVYSTLTSTGASDEPGVLVHIQTDDEINAFALAPASGNPPHAVAAREALRLAACEPDTPAAATLEEHHELLAAAFNGSLRFPAAAAQGQLSGVRSRCWNSCGASSAAQLNRPRATCCGIPRSSMTRWAPCIGAR